MHLFCTANTFGHGMVYISNSFVLFSGAEQRPVAAEKGCGRLAGSEGQEDGGALAWMCRCLEVEDLDMLCFESYR